MVPLWLTKLKNDLKAIHNAGLLWLKTFPAVADQVKERFESDSQPVCGREKISLSCG